MIDAARAARGLGSTKPPGWLCKMTTPQVPEPPPRNPHNSHPPAGYDADDYFIKDCLDCDPDVVTSCAGCVNNID